jgi:hypothetical protein
MFLFSIPGRPVWPNTGSNQPTAVDAHIHLVLHGAPSQDSGAGGHGDLAGEALELAFATGEVQEHVVDTRRS